MEKLIKANNDLKDLPRFMNHRSARMWFKERIGNRFVMVDTTVINNVKFYIYHLVHDKLTYAMSVNAMREGMPFQQSDFKNSFIELEISEEGYIFINERGNAFELSDERTSNRVYPKSSH
jgi:hypothetical protein